MNRQENQPNHGSVITTPEMPAFNFEAFANQPEYQDVNRAQVEKLLGRFPSPFFHIDVATGTGLVPKLLIDGSRRKGLSGQIIGIDPNNTSLDIARRTTPQGDGVSVLYISGLGQEIEELVKGKVPEEGAHSVSIHDALHEIESEEDKNIVLTAMRNVLRQGGYFSFNSAFTTYGMAPNPIPWGRWKATALGILGGKRDKTRESIKIYTPDDYRQMIEAIGLVVIHEARKIVNLSKEALIGISRYPKFIEGVFDDIIDQERYSLQQKSEALICALKNVEFIPRGWYEIIAQKPSPRTTSLA